MSDAEREAWRRITAAMTALTEEWRDAFHPRIRAAGSAVPTHPNPEEQK